ncbi:MAG: hypothetical protein ABDH23_07190 [Endomicrobiia bacterium]
MNKKINIVLASFVISIELFSATLPGWWFFQKNYTTTSEVFISENFLRIDTLQTISNHPACFSFYQGKAGMFMFTEVSTLNLIYSGIFYATKLKSIGISGGLIYNDTGKETIHYLQSGVEKSETINLQRDIFMISSLSKLIKDNISFSLTFKIANSMLQNENALAFAFDFNLFFYSIIKNSNLAVSFKNIGMSTSFKEESDSLPLSLSVTYSCKILRFFELGLNLPYVFNYRFSPSLGVAFTKDPVKVYLSYTFNKEDNNFGFGVSSNIQNFEIGYSIVPSKYLGVSHKVGLGYKF